MPHVLVRDVPDDVHAALQRKAEHRHQSLQQYLALELRHLAERRSINDVLDDVAAQHGGRVGLAAAIADLDEERAHSGDRCVEHSVIVVDASVLANALADDQDDGDTARRELRAAGEIAAPDLVDVETLSVLRKQWLRRTLTDQRFATALEHLQQLVFERVPTLRLLPRAFELRANVSAYDACYIALAERLGCELITADGRLATATGPRCPIRVLR